MNVLKTLNNNRFNDIYISVDSIVIKNPSELQIYAYNMNYKVKKSENFSALPFRCILSNGNATLHLTSVQNIISSIIRNEIMNKDIYSDFIATRKITVGLNYELSIEQIEQLVILFNATVLNTYLF